MTLLNTKPVAPKQHKTQMDDLILSSNVPEYKQRIANASSTQRKQNKTMLK